MSSRIEQLIDEIEEYIDSCKYQPLSNSKILVNKEEIDELLRELRMKTPDEIKRYQKIISNKEAILNDARTKAEALINEATVHTNELINEHEIMAQEILDNATMEANNVKAAAVQYTDEMLANLENLIAQTVAMTASHYESFINNLNGYAEVIRANRAELRPREIEDLLGEDGTNSALNLDMLKY